MKLFSLLALASVVSAQNKPVPNEFPTSCDAGESCGGDLCCTFVSTLG